jgi:glycosyltransferase involved in cell wall biosynthesis
MAIPFLLLMPSYNQAHYIVDAVNSILAQDDPDWELWIVDNSTDATREVMRQFTDPRIHFHHVPQRMDPGSCLNWMLERATGSVFSYVHTDNNLHVSYVRHMRAALASQPLGLAYCNSRAIDEKGRYTGIFLRGEFDLARLLSVDTLGVPFAATVELSKLIGGFSTRDFADDVRFCVSAFGLAQYIYVREPLVDYRLHSSSRTEEAGGHGQIQRLFVDLMPKILPGLEQRGLRPLQAMEQAIREGLDDIELCVEDFWYRKLYKFSPAWWQGPPRLDYFFLHGLLDLPGFTLKLGRPPRRFVIRSKECDTTVMPWSILAIKRYLYKQRRRLRKLTERPLSMLPTWACMKLGVPSNRAVAIRIHSLDTRTIWVARQLERSLGWKPLLDPSITAAPSWLNWGRANGTEPLLDCSNEISLTPPSSPSEPVSD